MLAFLMQHSSSSSRNTLDILQYDSERYFGLVKWSCFCCGFVCPSGFFFLSEEEAGWAVDVFKFN